MMKKYKQLSDRYHKTTAIGCLSQEEKKMYMTARLPATRAVLTRVLQEGLLRTHLSGCISLLDLCAGPGTASLVAAELLPIKSFTLVERDRGWADFAPVQFNYIWASLDKELKVVPHDLVVLSYGLNEMQPSAMDEIVEKCWELTKQVLIFVEPGTPKGYTRIVQARKKLIEFGAIIAAPCPHARQCPMEGTAKWCHFSQRLSRSREHRLMKGGELGFEDEKFSYVIATKVPSHPVSARLVGPPRLMHAGVALELCTLSGLERKVLLKSERASYKRVKKLSWGDGFDA